MRMRDSSAADPVVTMPLYGKEHVRQHPKDVILLDVTRNQWLDELNRDPRTRTMAGVGTLAIQENQDKYMKAAWLQIDRINEANRKIRFFLPDGTSRTTMLRIAPGSAGPYIVTLAPGDLVVANVHGPNRGRRR